jgi:hypothetical protein
VKRSMRVESVRLSCSNSARVDQDTLAVGLNASLNYRTPNPLLKLVLNATATGDTGASYSVTVSPVVQYNVSPNATFSFGGQATTSSGTGTSYGVGFTFTVKK